ncbi:DUF3592 domain-containing protein [Jiangella rhizosphaerae]|uniref:DUF3592 domain-containing protein n=1 Tax=Jiangella rhizosphaerae TaxID=2293569 RepID=A0A418KRW4_9ACTN|nr:DUF3592 domain-containing protein [Jiangella rhizosphaerae]RIQ26254.1 hypothetical protein DY240_10720 [Jiangella rhizosphaerae]
MGNILRIVIGLAGLVAAAWSASRTLRMRRHGRPADAVVRESTLHHRTGGQGERSSRWVSTVAFRDEDGVERTSILPGRLTAGETVPILYLPDGSERVVRAGKASFRETFAILGATAAGIALTLLI